MCRTGHRLDSAVTEGALSVPSGMGVVSLHYITGSAPKGINNDNDPNLSNVILV